MITKRAAMEALLEGRALLNLDDGMAVVPDLRTAENLCPAETLYMRHANDGGGGWGSFLNGLDVKAIEQKDIVALTDRAIECDRRGERGWAVTGTVREDYPADGSCSMSAPELIDEAELEAICEKIARVGGRWYVEDDRSLAAELLPDARTLGAGWARSPQHSADMQGEFAYTGRHCDREVGDRPAGPIGPDSPPFIRAAALVKDWLFGRRMSGSLGMGDWGDLALDAICSELGIAYALALDEACFRAACLYVAGNATRIPAVVGARESWEEEYEGAFADFLEVDKETLNFNLHCGVDDIARSIGTPSLSSSLASIAARRPPLCGRTASTIRAQEKPADGLKSKRTKGI